MREEERVEVLTSRRRNTEYRILPEVGLFSTNTGEHWRLQSGYVIVSVYRDKDVLIPLDYTLIGLGLVIFALHVFSLFMRNAQGAAAWLEAVAETGR